jgi:hypothetical protein
MEHAGANVGKYKSLYTHEESTNKGNKFALHDWYDSSIESISKVRSREE